MAPTTSRGRCAHGTLAGSGFNPLPHGATSATRSGRRSRASSTSVSIPYLTGRPLQQGVADQRRLPLAGCFNPLPHGATSATGLLVAYGGCGVLFQSPTSRGDLCNISACIARSRTRSGFNPLPHGATSATGRRWRSTTGERPRVSIPYLTGRPLQPAMRVTFRDRPLCVSIPYLTGRPLQLIAPRR